MHIKNFQNSIVNNCSVIQSFESITNTKALVHIEKFASSINTTTALNNCNKHILINNVNIKIMHSYKIFSCIIDGGIIQTADCLYSLGSMYYVESFMSALCHSKKNS